MKSLYIHIPFCKSKCYYCDFNSYCGKEDLFEDYINTVTDAIDCFAESYYTVYFGGGTPSFIPSKYIKEIIKNIKCDGEITLELNPGTITKEKLLEYKQCGINRLSIGLQTVQDELLKKIGRIHTLKEFEEAYYMAREVGFKNISVDLMFGLPGQTIENVKESLNYILKINPEHVSCYSLIVHDELMDKHPGAFKNLPSDEVEREMYYLICKELKEAGYIQYEISNFSKPGFESQHNLCYWNQNEYYGVGAGASGYVDGVRYKNVDDIEEYIAKMKGAKKPNFYESDNCSPYIIEEIQTPESKIKEYMILKLRLLQGVSKKEAFKKFNIDILDYFKDEISKMQKLGLLETVDERNDQYVRLTNKGLDLANIVWEEFI